MVPVMRRILSFIFTTNSAIWFEKDLTEELVDYKAKIPVKIDMNSTSRTIEWLKNLKLSWVVHPKEIAAALEYNHFWPSVCTNGKIIGCTKVGFGKVYIVDYNRVIEFPERMAFIYDIFILKDYRGKDVAKNITIQAIKFLKEHGYTKVGLHVPPWNKAPISICEKIGFKKVIYIRYFRIFGVSIKIASPTKGLSIFKGGKIMREEIPYG